MLPNIIAKLLLKAGMRAMTVIIGMGIGCLPIFSGIAENTETALGRIDYQLATYPQEKLHTVTDRGLYVAGDTVWFRTFVVDAANHRQVAMSKYVYVELLNPFGEVEKRVKIKERDRIYAGYLPIDEEIGEGDYTLAAYTMYSENQGKDYFFRKPIRILARQSARYVIDSDFTATGPGEVRGSFRINSIDGSNLNYKFMSWKMPDGDFREMPDATAGFSRKFRRDKGENVVLVRFGDYRKYVPVEYPVEKTDVTFYPEGGWLIEGEPCTVAFKATDENGKGVAVTGAVLDENGEKLVEFNTVHDGMGSFTFVPEEGCMYTAEYIGPEGEIRKADIGTPKRGAASLRYRSVGDNGIFSVAGGEGRDLELVVALRGQGMIAAPISSATPLTLDRQHEMPPGLYQAILVSRSDSAVMSERLFFIGAEREACAAAELKSDSASISLRMPEGLTGDCTVRVINGEMLPGSPGSDIRSQLLLQSELRGRIENPSYYFSAASREAQRDLDLLMMVNGWSRYNLPEAILGRYEEPELPLEIGQEITGQVRSRWKGKPMKGVLMSVIVPEYNFGTFAETDSKGNFRINGFDLPEGASFIFRAMNAKGGNEGNYYIDKDSLPSVEILREKPAEASAVDASDYFKAMRWVMLDEVKVQAFNYGDDDFNVLRSLASYSNDSENMALRGITSLEQAVRFIPGMTLRNGMLMYRNKYVGIYIDGDMFTIPGDTPSGGGILKQGVFSPHNPLPRTYHRSRFASSSQASQNNAPMVMVDDTPSPSIQASSALKLSDVANAVSFQDIDRIDYIRAENFVIGPSPMGGALMITTKTGANKSSGKQFELKDYLPLGYQKHKEYSSPILSVDADDYDLQTQPTLMWIPSVKFDEAGETICLSHEIKPEYRIIIEGISDNGDVISDVLNFRPEVRN